MKASLKSSPWILKVENQEKPSSTTARYESESGSEVVILIKDIHLNTVALCFRNRFIGMKSRKSGGGEQTLDLGD